MGDRVRSTRASGGWNGAGSTPGDPGRTRHPAHPRSCARVAVQRAGQSRRGRRGRDARPVRRFGGLGHRGPVARSGLLHVRRCRPGGPEAVEANLRSTGFTALATVVGGDALVWLDRPGTTTRFDLVLCDPPYAFTDAQWTELFAALVPHVGRVDGGPGVVVVESDRSVPLPKGWHPLRTKAYGDTIVLVLQPPDGPRTDGRRA